MAAKTSKEKKEKKVKVCAQWNQRENGGIVTHRITLYKVGDRYEYPTGGEYTPNGAETFTVL